MFKLTQNSKSSIRMCYCCHPHVLGAYTNYVSVQYLLEKIDFLILKPHSSSIFIDVEIIATVEREIGTVGT